MKIIIDIPKEQYTTLNAKTQDDIVDVIDHGVLIKAIKNGTPLPVRHGRLIDADALEYSCDFEKCVPQTGTGCNHCQYHTITEYEIDNSPTIIEADKEGE